MIATDTRRARHARFTNFTHATSDMVHELGDYCEQYSIDCTVGPLPPGSYERGMNALIDAILSRWDMTRGDWWAEVKRRGLSERWVWLNLPEILDEDH